MLRTQNKKKTLQVAGVEAGRGETHDLKRRITADTASGTMQVKRQWCNIFEILKERFNAKAYTLKKCLLKMNMNLRLSNKS